MHALVCQWNVQRVSVDEHQGLCVRKFGYEIDLFQVYLQGYFDRYNTTWMMVAMARPILKNTATMSQKSSISCLQNYCPTVTYSLHEKRQQSGISLTSSRHSYVYPRHAGSTSERSTRLCLGISILFPPEFVHHVPAFHNLLTFETKCCNFRNRIGQLYEKFVVEVRIHKDVSETWKEH